MEEPETARDDYVAKMLVKPISEYEGVVPNVSETDTDYVIGTDKVELVISKADSRMRMINAQTDEVVWSEKAPLQYGNGKTTQTTSSVCALIMRIRVSAFLITSSTFSVPIT